MTTPSPLSVAIVGCGIIGVNHAQAIARVEGLRVTALVDDVPAMATALADQIAAESGQRPAEYARIEDMPADVDLVAICTPSGTHVDLAERALARGTHVVLEKPLDVSMERGLRLARAAEAAAERGLVVSVISQHRFDPGAVVVAEAAHSGRFGRVTSAVASVPWWRSQEYYDSGAWRGTWALDGGGAVMNQGVHTVDLLVWFLGRPVEIFAQTGLLAHERIEIEDVATATLRFESGALAVFHATTAAFPHAPVRVAVYGSAGSGTVEDDQLGAFYVDGDERERSADVVPEGERVGDDKGPASFAEAHARQYRDVLAAIREERAPRVGVPEALLSLAVVRAMYVSATSGEPVRIDAILSGELSDAGVRTGGVIA
ncbi:Gfo/Idh/MocA family protein [Microbacterium nymphoidis]|uniref:Gfo/Idh/MocA family protein n=1 Tax=Microbacterium nymphoidis TaxID=2898586 RepID=UPI001E5F144E|nr:Gfo/Idh/MocA family oxidoreductase [Microbacterium nymphoidis]MCD2499489.1 Gfo/Idh/MocA family oxidoreductase [Microbacterium nymphoidis]